jgi:hypothetical protein
VSFNSHASCITHHISSDTDFLFFASFASKPAAVGLIDRKPAGRLLRLALVVKEKTVNRQTLYRFLLVGLLLALLAMPVLGAAARPDVAVNNLGHFITLQGKGTSAGPAAVIACTPPSSGSGCGGG